MSKTNTGEKQSSLQNASVSSKRDLERDKVSNLLGLTPESIAEVEQPVLIYNPSRKVYAFVSNDHDFFGNKDYYIEAKEDRSEKRNTFIIRKVPNEKGKYYIFNENQNAYMYLEPEGASFRFHTVKASIGDIPSGSEDKVDSYKFDIFKDDSGFYQIRNKKYNMYLLVPGEKEGIVKSDYVIQGGNENLLHGRQEYSLFQFVLKNVSSPYSFYVTKQFVLPPILAWTFAFILVRINNVICSIDIEM